MDLTLDDIDSVINTDRLVFKWTAFGEFFACAIFLLYVIPCFYFYLVKQRVFFEKIFVLLSLKMIAENKRLLRRRNPNDRKRQKTKNRRK